MPDVGKSPRQRYKSQSLCTVFTYTARPVSARSEPAHLGRHTKSRSASSNKFTKLLYSCAYNVARTVVIYNIIMNINIFGEGFVQVRGQWQNVLPVVYSELFLMRQRVGSKRNLKKYTPIFLSYRLNKVETNQFQRQNCTLYIYIFYILYTFSSEKLHYVIWHCKSTIIKGSKDYTIYSHEGF